MKNDYILPCAEILLFMTEDILTSSSGNGDSTIPDIGVEDEGEF